MQIGAVRMAHTIEPTAFPEATAVDDERIAFPPSDRIAHPSRVRIFRERTAIQKDLPENVVLLVKDKDHLRRLDDLPCKWHRGGGRHARRLASRRRTEFPMRIDALFQQRLGPWLDQDIFRLEIRHNVCEVARNHY